MISDNPQQDITALKNQIFTLLVALIVVSGTLTTMLYQQASQANKDIAQGQQLAAVLNQNEANMTAFATKLVAYSDKHPDLKPILLKYGLNAAALSTAPKK
jgi:hypothetical protein